MLLESHSPDTDALPNDASMRRIAFYRGLGAHWLRGLDYAIPAHTNPDSYIFYNVLLFRIAGPIEPDLVQKAVRELVAGVIPEDDDHYRRLAESFPRMFIHEPQKSE